MVHAPPPLRSHAREMRRAPTRSEDRIWSWLRDRRFGGYKFRRQHPAGDYILDFYCSELKLAIEMDGVHHDTDFVAERDKARTRYLERQGIVVVRIGNELLICDVDSAADCIRAAIERARRKT